MRVLATLLLGLSACARPTGDRPSVHGMLLVGERRAYLSHLPLYHSPHDYQAILAVELDARELYLADRQKSGERVYTVVPETFRLPSVKQRDFRFAADVVRGHFERGGATIGRSAVRVVRVIHFEKLRADAPRPNALEYFLFGTVEEAFLAHAIAGRPDFDQIVAVRLPPESAVVEGARVRFSGHAAAPLAEGEELDALVDGRTVRLTIGAQLYLERGDLAQ